MSEPTPIHPIRQRLIDDMTLRGFTAPTQKSYIRIVRNRLRDQPLLALHI